MKTGRTWFSSSSCESRDHHQYVVMRAQLNGHHNQDWCPLILFVEPVFAEILVPGSCVQKAATLSIRAVTERGPRKVQTGVSGCLGNMKIRQLGPNASGVLSKQGLAGLKCSCMHHSIDSLPCVTIRTLRSLVPAGPTMFAVISLHHCTFLFLTSRAQSEADSHTDTEQMIQ